MKEPLFPPVPPHECGPGCSHKAGILPEDKPIPLPPPQPLKNGDPFYDAIHLLRKCNMAHNGLCAYPLKEVTAFLAGHGGPA